MKKSLLIVALMAAGSMTAAMAKSEVFVFDYLGEVDGLADNGQYAAISDPATAWPISGEPKAPTT